MPDAITYNGEDKWKAKATQLLNQGITVPDMTGATASTPGIHGLVPAPQIADKEKFLKGDGTWGTPSGSTISDMTGATSSTAGVHGLVPAPAAGDNLKFLRGDGTWQTVSGGGGTNYPFSLKNRYFIFIGDSYSVGITYGGTITSWLDYFLSWYGSEIGGYYRNNVGGYGFAKEDYRFITLLQELESSVTNKNIITDIVVEGGYNDHAWLTYIDQYISQFATYARQTYPNATLWIAPVSRGINQYEEDAAAANDIYINSGMRYGYNICGEITRTMLDTSLYSEDLIHPNETGYKRIARLMHQCLTTGSCDIAGASDTSSSTTGTNGFALQKYGNVVEMRANNVAGGSLGTVPTEYRPRTATHYFPAIVLGTGNAWFYGWIGVATDGSISLRYISSYGSSPIEITNNSSFSVYGVCTWII